ncbi:hypothetical protein H6P81_021461 [Aristolochia fimbriata]|uniref:Uncharacterized protein n=1 Tax=Aristolochia fimbriata TaxID=158543 RepID=A0AAV7DPV7_ARIFI|nr:hypothetical protein H6P81_021461 [Aristolochia fimbriata]
MTNCVNQRFLITRLNYYQRLVIGGVKLTCLRDGLNPTPVPYWWVNNPTLGEFCFTMIGRADIEGSKQRRYERLGCHKPGYPCGNFFDTSSFKFRRCAASQTPTTMSSMGYFRPALEKKEGNAPPPTNGIKITLREHPRGPSQCFVLIKRSVPLVGTSSGRLFGRGKAPKGGRSIRSPARRGDDLSPMGSSFEQSHGRPAGWGPWDPVPNPPSQSFSRLRIHFADFPCLHCSIDRGCSPWRPDAVMSTTRRGGTFGPSSFQGRPGRTPDLCGVAGGQAVKAEKITLPGAPPGVSGLPSVAVKPCVRFRNFNPIPFEGWRDAALSYELPLSLRID